MKFNQLEEKVYSNILNNKLIKKNDKVLVAVSSGSDSMCLVNSLINLKEEIGFEIYICHVNHSLREQSKQEYEYIKEYCNAKNIKLFYHKFDALKQSKLLKKGIEEVSRNVRYEFFNKILKEEGFNKIAIAHNKNDNVETILFNILRGTSLKGLTGMDFENDIYIRPLINIEKKEIINYCNNINLNFFNDSSNFEETYTRNRIRLSLIPYLKKEFNENIEESILRLSKTAKIDEDFLNKYTNDIVNDIIEENNSKIEIKYKELLKYHRSIVNRSVLKIIEKVMNNTQGISYIHINDIVKLFENGIKNKKYIIGNKFTIEILDKEKCIIYLNRRD